MAKCKTITIISLLVFILGCTPIQVEKTNRCVSIYYQELNSGTYSNIITAKDSGGVAVYRLGGRYEKNEDGTITLVGAGNRRIRVGLTWHTVLIDPDMEQLAIYLHPNCRFCAKLQAEAQ